MSQMLSGAKIRSCRVAAAAALDLFKSPTCLPELALHRRAAQDTWNVPTPFLDLAVAAASWPGD
eukprot:363013-Chlamydomonas_euryale.AAC.1